MRAEGERVALAAVEENARRILDYTDPPFIALMKEEEFRDLASAFLDLLHPAPQPPLAQSDPPEAA